MWKVPTKGISDNRRRYRDLGEQGQWEERGFLCEKGQKCPG